MGIWRGCQEGERGEFVTLVNYVPKMLPNLMPPDHNFRLEIKTE
jgi:hypothetical protein